MSTPIVTPGANAPLTAAPLTQAAPAVVDPAAAPAAAAPAPEAPKKEDDLAARFAAISRQDKALRAKQLAFETQRETQEREWSARLESTRKYEELRSKAQAGDRTAAQELLKESGLTFDQLTKLNLNGGKPTAEMIAEDARREVEALRKEQQAREEAAKTQAEKDKETKVSQAVQAFKAQIADVLKGKPDEFELTLNYQDPHSGVSGADLVYQVIDAHYEQTEKETGTGRVMSHEDAAKAVEAWLEKDYEEKILSRKKIQAKLTKPAAGSDPAALPGSAPAPSAQAHGLVPASSKPVVTRTLTNQDQTTVATAPKTKTLTREESLAEAAKLIRWV